MNRLNALLKSGRDLFHTQDLALLWEIQNRNTLRMTISRYIKRGFLIKITKGLYSTVPIEDINIAKLGSALLHKYCYVSCETILAREGIINQIVYPITFVSSISTKIKYGENQYVYRQIKPEILFDTQGIIQKNGYFEASKDRAISDMIHFNPKYYFDNLIK